MLPFPSPLPDQRTFFTPLENTCVEHLFKVENKRNVKREKECYLNVLRQIGMRLNTSPPHLGRGCPQIATT
jgi:hypothetical protein